MSKRAGKRARNKRPSSPPATTKARVAPDTRSLAAIGAVVAVALAACIAGLANDFVYDDILVLLHDDRITNPSNWMTFLTSSYWPPPHPHDLYRPVASLILAAQFVLGGGAPLIYRVVSYALYAASAIGVWRLATRMLPRNEALAASILFAAHPVHVEAVALGVNQGELIVAILCCWAICFYIDRRRAGHLTLRDWVMLSAVYAVAALTKENGFVLPGLLAAAELLVIDGPSFGERVSSVARGFIGLAGLGIALVVIRAAVLDGNVVGAFTAEALVGLGLGGRLLTMLRVVPIWLRLLVWPAHLQADYSPDEVVASSSFGGMELVGLIVLLCAIGIAVRSRRRAPAVTFGLAWCAIALFPVSNIVPTSITVAERTLFLPSVGFLIACTALVAWALRATPFRRPELGALVAGGCCLLAGLGVARSAQRESSWRNSARFWRTAATDAPRSTRVKRAREQAVLDLTKEFEPALRSSPTPWEVRNELALLLRALDEDSAAADQLRMSLTERPRQPSARQDFVAALLALGKYREAMQFVDADSTARSTAETDSTMRFLRRTADSAARVSAPPGSVRLHLIRPGP